MGKGGDVSCERGVPVGGKKGPQTKKRREKTPAEAHKLLKGGQ